MNKMNEEIVKKTIIDYLRRAKRNPSFEFKKMCACKHKCLCFEFSAAPGGDVTCRVLCYPFKWVIQTTFRMIAWRWAPETENDWKFCEADKGFFNRSFPGNHVLMCDDCQNNPKFVRRNSV